MALVDSNGGVINPEDSVSIGRTTPEHKFVRTYAKGGMVVMVVSVGGVETESEVTRKEALNRAQAINAMIPKSKYQSDKDLYTRMVTSMIASVKKAKENDGGRYKSTKVSMALACNTDPRKPLLKDKPKSRIVIASS